MTQSRTDNWLLLPGTLCTPDVFAPVLDQMHVAAENRHFIEIAKPLLHDYDASLRAAITDDAIVCGFSLGAMIAAHNLDALARAKALVLLACNPFPDPIGNRTNREAVRDRILTGGARDWVDENWEAMSTAPSETLRETVIAMAETMAHLIPAQTELAASRPGAAEKLSATKLPLVFVTGTQDQLTPPDPLRPIVTRAENATLETLEGLGHFALLEAPDRMAAAILKGLNAVTPSPHTES